MIIDIVKKNIIHNWLKQQLQKKFDAHLYINTLLCYKRFHLFTYLGYKSLQAAHLLTLVSQARSYLLEWAINKKIVVSRDQVYFGVWHLQVYIWPVLHCLKIIFKRKSPFLLCPTRGYSQEHARHGLCRRRILN